MTNTITALYDTIRLEEKLLIESAKKNDINLEMVDCKNLFVNLNDKKSFDGPVLQRCVSYYRNLHSTAALRSQVDFPPLTLRDRFTTVPHSRISDCPRRCSALYRDATVHFG